MLIQTVASVGYLPLTNVLFDSIRKHSKAIKFCILVSDVSRDGLNKIRKHFPNDVSLICCDDFKLDYLSNMRGYYDALEFNSACKVLALHHQIIGNNCGECLFLDPDMYLFGDVHELVKDCPKDLMLTPHSTTAYPDDGEVPNNLEFVQAGHINGGIVYVKKSSETVAALEWLVQQTKCKWFVAPRSGMYGDQQWLSLFPIFFNDITHVSMNPAVNIAYWNLHGRRLSEQSDRFLVNDGLPALLFHFSGFNIPSGGMLSKHSNRRFDDTTESVIAKLVPMYENLLLQSRQHYKTLGLIAEFKFATTPLGIRMSQASKLWDFNSVYIDDTKGFFARAGRYLDRMIFSI